MMARLEMVEVLLTARMGDVFHRFGYSVLAGNGALPKLNAESVVIQTGHPRRLRKRQPAPRIKTASQLNLHVALPFARAEWQAREGFGVQIESDAQGETLASPADFVKTRCLRGHHFQNKSSPLSVKRARSRRWSSG